MSSGHKVNQAAAIPFRHQNGQVEYCLITALSQPDFWTIPKGTIEPGDTAEVTALKEAEEEAGILGKVVGECLGSYVYEKSGARLKVAVFLMQVNRVLDRWDESHVRKRQWVNGSDALRILSSHPAIQLIQSGLVVAAATA